MSSLRNGIIVVLTLGTAVLGADRIGRSKTDRQIAQQLEALHQAQRDLREQQDTLRVEQARAARSPLPTWTQQAAAVAARPEAESPPAPAAAPPRQPPPTIEEMQTGLDRAFSAETPDALWSTSAQQTVRAGLGRLLGEGSSLASLRCGSTLCRIETSHHTKEEYQKFLENSFASADNGMWNGATFSSLTYDSGGEVVAVSYLAREGAALPRLTRP